MASTSYTFSGWVGHDKKAADGNLKWERFEPKRWEETDIDIRVTHCGMCGSDLHTLRSGWYPAPYPIIVGHEIVGEVIRVGSRAAGNHQVGDRVGVGCLTDNCQGLSPDGRPTCDACAGDDAEEQFCAHARWTYPGPHHNGDKGYGGYATHHRCPGRFAFKLPATLPSAQAAPLLCAGLTMYAPLKRHGCGPGRVVGVAGLGGLGHYGVLLARALGADIVVAISRRADKRAEALAMGADDYLATEDADGGEAKGWGGKYRGKLHLVVSTVASARAPIKGYLALLRRHGTLVQVGYPDDGPLDVPTGQLLMRGLNFAGSSIGSAAEMRELLQLAADRQIRGWVEQRPMRDANQAVLDLEAGRPRYRYCLVNGDGDGEGSGGEAPRL